MMQHLMKNFYTVVGKQENRRHLIIFHLSPTKSTFHVSNFKEFRQFVRKESKIRVYPELAKSLVYYFP